MILLTMVNQAPKDLTTLLWILAAGSAGVIAYLFIRLEKSKTDCDTRLDALRTEEKIRYDKLAVDFSNYKDKTTEERIETLEKVLVTISSFEKAIEDLPEKVVSKSVTKCRQNVEKLLNKERNG